MPNQPLQSMMTTDSNPYAPPASAGVLAKHRPIRGSLPIAMTAAAVALAYIVLTIVLFRANDQDRQAGMMFILNIPVLVGLAIASARSTQVGVRLGVAASFVQGAIMSVLLFTPGVMIFPLIIINFAVVFPVLAISAWAWFHAASHSECTESDNIPMHPNGEAA
jgi:hypothetical protein